MAAIPMGICQMLDSALEEELYADYLTLLDQVVTSFPIAERYLTICCSLLVRDASAGDVALELRCRRLLRKVANVQALAAWRRVVRFEHDNLARGGRRKKRRLTTETAHLELGDEEDEVCPLALTESVFVRFASLWELLAHAVAHADETRWLALANILTDVMLLDYETQKALKKDFGKTILATALAREYEASRSTKKAIGRVFDGRNYSKQTEPTPGRLEAIALLTRFARLLLESTSDRLSKVMDRDKCIDWLSEELLHYSRHEIDHFLQCTDAGTKAVLSQAVLAKLCVANSIALTDLTESKSWEDLAGCMVAPATSGKAGDQIKVDHIKVHLLSACQRLFPHDEDQYVDAVRQLRLAVKEHHDKPRDLIHAVYCMR